MSQDENKKPDLNTSPDEDIVDIESDDLEFDENDDQIVSKIKKLRQKLKEAEKEKSEYLAGWQRAKADYINLKRDTEKEKQDLTKWVREGLLHDLLPLADSFELAMSNKEIWEQAPENWRKGIEYIYSQLQTILKDNGLEQVNPLGEKFDPTIHDCIGTIDVDKKEDDDKILEVLKKGYVMNGKVVRPAQVKVGTRQNFSEKNLGGQEE